MAKQMLQRTIGHNPSTALTTLWLFGHKKRPLPESTGYGIFILMISTSWRVLKWHINYFKFSIWCRYFSKDLEQSRQGGHF